MNINNNTAQHIVDQLRKGISTDIWIVNHANQVLASTKATDSEEASLPAGWRPLDEIGTADDCVSLPLCFATEEIGRLIIEHVPQHSRETVQIAHTLAELIIHQRAVFAQMFDRQWALDKFIGDLLHERFTDAPQTAFENALLLEINLDLPRVAIVFDIQPCFASEQPLSSDYDTLDGTEQWFRQKRRRMLDLAQRVLGSRNDNIYSFFEAQRLVVLAAIDERKAEIACQRLKRMSQTLIDELGRCASGALSAGIGAYYAGWQALARSYHDARFALETGQTLLGTGRAFTPFDLGLAGFVCAHDDTTKSQLADYLLRPLLDKPELLQTLEIFLETGLSAGASAEQLHMHRHGLTYRLKKIYELTGLDPSDFRAAAQLAAALQWHRVAQAARV